MRTHFLRIVLPTLVSAALLVFAIFFVLIPALEASILERKREMIRELTNSAWNILANFEQQVKDGRLSRAEAQAAAVKQIQNLHYGPSMKDYFWINDMHPRMVVHPYRYDLNGQDVSDFRDPKGKRLFVEVVEVVRRDGAGYVTYEWQWKDDPTHVVPKLSYVKGFAPWGWVIGTGVYLDDVGSEIRQVTRRLAGWSSAILGVVAVLLFLIARQSFTADRLRRAAEGALRASEERYRTLVESAGESIFMALKDDHLYANASAASLLGYSPEELRRLSLGEIIVPEKEEGGAEAKRFELPTAPCRRDLLLRRKDGGEVHAMVSFSPITVGERTGHILVASDITQRKRDEQERGAREAQLREQMASLREKEAQRETTLAELRMALSLLRSTTDERGGLHFLEEIRRASSVAEVARLNRALPTLVKSMFDNGASATLINRLITLNTDVVNETLIRLALGELGPPPVPFVFLIMGSEGRREQTLKTDQDNAIAFADPPASELTAVHAYFDALATRVCADLDAAGYARCKHRVMADNSELRQPLSAWKRMFRGWIETLEAEDLLQAKILFDFRAGYGEAALADELRQSLFADLDDNPAFFAHLARNVLRFSAPLGVFGQFHLEEAAGGRRGVNVKSAMIPIVDFARIYALRARVEAANTVQRLEAVRDGGVISAQTFLEVREVYGTLMRIRISGQLRAVAEGRPPDNLIEPSHITYLEQRILKESFAQIRHFQTRLAYDFTGVAEVPT